MLEYDPNRRGSACEAASNDDAEASSAAVPISSLLADARFHQTCPGIDADQLTALLELGPVTPWISDSSGNLIWLGRSGLERLGLNPSQPLALWGLAMHPHDRGRFLAAWSAARRSGDNLDQECRLRLKGEGYRWTRLQAVARRDSAGVVTRWYGTAEDCHERRLAAEALQGAEEKYRHTLKLCGLIPWSADASGRKIDVDQEWFDITGTRKGLGLEAVEQADAEGMAHAWRSSVASGTPFEREFRVRMKDGTARWFRSRAAPLRAWHGAIVKWYGILEDVDAKRIAEDEIRWRATHDPLTATVNRTAFYGALADALAQADGSDRPVGVMLFDLDNFKQVNDTLGHMAGDQVLRQFSRILSTTPEAALVARLGGDEFAVLLGGDSEAKIEDATSAIFRSVQEGVIRLENMIDQHASAGVAIFPAHGSEASELLKNADIALQDAKANGRSCLRTYRPEMREPLERHASMLVLARQAVSCDRVQPFYQPKVDLATGRTIGFEALLRWHHPTNGLQPPDTIAAAFDHPQLSVEVSRCMTTKIIRDISEWLDGNVPFGHVALNVSSADLRRPDFAECLLGMLTDANIPPSLLQIEVTESVFLGRGAECVEQVLHSLRAEGFSIALDDFGTGFASLSHLQRFPVQVLKIDKSFVEPLCETQPRSPIVQAVIGLSKSFGMVSVAEGIETRDQARLLKEAGCDVGQGYFFGHPQPAGSVPDISRSTHDICVAGMTGRSKGEVDRNRR